MDDHQGPAKIYLEHVTFAYGDKVALNDVTLAVPPRSITVLLGPAGGGRTTLLRLINRLNDLVEGVTLSGRILIDDRDIYAPDLDVIQLRRRVGMVFALPLPLPGTIRQNLTYGPTLAGIRQRSRLNELVEQTLRQAALWDEVKDRLDDPAMALSGGQQQRLCLARTLALEPDIILLDEPTSGLDPISTAKVEDSLQALKNQYTIVIVPHSIQQGARVADYAAFLLSGELVESGPPTQVFDHPIDQRTEDYITGRFG
ncbi:MAG: phosphate ABC transporter ATP-binding protein [Anaerolineae bacterium]|nr:phosphate ABC transporter ATP-binding protein [Anaerolineales bacterium]MCQ3974087.1 phosphate ABC transporter ATP-binding protein [Anaerolineae bacterium]